MKTTKNTKYLTTINQIYKEVLDTYPFLTSEERLIYDEKVKEVLDHTDPYHLLEETERLFGLLHNPHADIWPVKEEKDKKPPQKPELRIDDEILYIRVPAWTKRLENLAKDLISFCKENKDNYKTVIVDVIDNTGGSSFIAHKFAGIFFKDDVLFGRFIKRIKGEGLQEKDAVISANGEVYIDKPLTILISNKCFSSNELFLAPFKVAGRATLIGEKTAGGSGNPVEIGVNINGKKYTVRIPTWRFVLKGETKPIEETAIIPDAPYFKEDIVEYAKKYLKSGYLKPISTKG